MNDWNIQCRAHECQACSRPFKDQQVYHTLLFDEKQDFKRLDICRACWEEQYSQGASDRKGFVSHWHGTYEAPPGAPPERSKRKTPKRSSAN